MQWKRDDKSEALGIHRGSSKGIAERDDRYSFEWKVREPGRADPLLPARAPDCLLAPPSLSTYSTPPIPSLFCTVSSFSPFHSSYPCIPFCFLHCLMRLLLLINLLLVLPRIFFSFSQILPYLSFPCSLLTSPHM